MAEIEAQSAIIHDRENPFTRKHRRGILATWSITLMEKYPDLPTEDHWASHIVLKEAKPYLRWRVSAWCLFSFRDTEHHTGRAVPR